MFHLRVGRSEIEWKLKVKTQISVFPWAKIGQNDHSNPYIENTTVLSDISSIVTARPLSPQEGARSRSPQLSLALWGERERSGRQYRSQVAVFKSALFTEHSNADNIKKRRTVADSVADSVTSVGESGDMDPCLSVSIASLGVNSRPSYLVDGEKARLPLI